MKNYAIGPIYLLIGAFAGVFTATAAIESFGTAALGPGKAWQLWDTSDASESRLYVLARYLSLGRLPPADGQFQEFMATTDSEGSRLSPGCVYRLSFPKTPKAWWSLTALSGNTVWNPGGTMMTADTAIAEADGKLQITLSPSPQPGNWMKLPPAGRYSILLSMATSRFETEAGGESSELPAIERRGC